MIEKLTVGQALKVLTRLSEKGGEIGDAVLTEAMKVLSEIDLDGTAASVFFVLDSINVQDCWDRSGKTRHGYTSPDEAAVEIMEEELQPFFDQVAQYHELGMPEQETTYCMGVILGIFRYEQESRSGFKEWSVDIPIECAGYLLDEWRKRNRVKATANAMDEFIQSRCPKWAKYLTR